MYRIELSDGSGLMVKTAYLPSLYQKDIEGFLNKSLSSEEEEALQFAGACFQAEQTALGLIARAEQSGLGLSAKLERRGYSRAAVQRVVSHLRDLEILNDRRYAELWLQGRLSRKQESPRSLIAALSNRGIDRRCAAAALKSVLSFEGERQLLKKYLETHTAVKSELKYEGFSPGVIQSVWEEQEL